MVDVHGEVRRRVVFKAEIHQIKKETSRVDCEEKVDSPVKPDAISRLRNLDLILQLICHGISLLGI